MHANLPIAYKSSRTRPQAARCIHTMPSLYRTTFSASSQDSWPFAHFSPSCRPPSLARPKLQIPSRLPSMILRTIIFKAATYTKLVFCARTSEGGCCQLGGRNGSVFPPWEFPQIGLGRFRAGWRRRCNAGDARLVCWRAGVIMVI
jgi:hypothetical protein